MPGASTLNFFRSPNGLNGEKFCIRKYEVFFSKNFVNHLIVVKNENFLSLLSLATRRIIGENFQKKVSQKEIF